MIIRLFYVKGDRMQKRYPIQFIHIFLAVVLLVMALFCIGAQTPYTAEIESSQLKNPEFAFLQKGQYIIHVTYENGIGKSIVVCSEAVSAAESDLPYRELAREETAEENGIVAILLDLDQGTHAVKLQWEDSSKNVDETAAFRKIEIQSVHLENRDGYFLAALFAACAAAVLMLGRCFPVEKYGRLLFLIGMGLAASFPLFSDNLCMGEDMLYHITRLEGIYQGLCNGEFPVRINPLQSAGYGNLSATMYPSLFLYPAALLRFAGVSVMMCYKILLISMNIATAFFSFYAVRNITRSEKSAWIMSVLYTFATYRLTNLYYRAALGESLAMVFLPLLLWGAYEVLYGEEKKWYLLVLGISGVLESHVLSFEMCLLFLVAEGIVWLAGCDDSDRRTLKRRIVALLKAVVITIGANAAFLVPFLYYAGQDFQVFHMPAEVAGSGVYLTQMFQLYPPADGMNLLQGTSQGEMPLSVGFVLLAGLIVFLIMLFRKTPETTAVKAGKHCLCYGVVSLLLVSWLCPWEKLQNLQLFHLIAVSLQFAWRFLGPAALFLCVVSAVSFVWLAEKINAKYVVYGMVLLLVMISTGYYFDRTAHDMKQTADKMELEGQMYSDGMYMYWDGDSFKALQLNYQLEDNRIRTEKGSEIRYRDLVRQGNRIQFQLEQCGREDDFLVFPVYYYPGYEVRVDGKAVETQVIDTRVACRMPSAPAVITIRYVEQPLFIIADVISLVVIVLLIFHIAKRPQKR